LLLSLKQGEFVKYQGSPAFSEEGLARLRKFALSLRGLRRNLNGSITEAIIEVEQFLSLDTEVLVRDGWQSGRRNLDRFLDEAARFEKNGGTLLGFLQWLKIAEDTEGGLKPAEVDVRSDAVQILTIHSAKGAEWDYVAIPGLAEKTFPSVGKKSDNWVKNAGSIPVSMRGDYEQLPSINFDSFSTNKNLKDGLERFEDEWKVRKSMEEMRLAYVAITRAKKGLICTTSHFRNGEKLVDPSTLFNTFANALIKIKGGTVLTDTPIPEGRNPIKENPTTGIWPTRSSKLDKLEEVANGVEAATPFTPNEVNKLINEATTDTQRVSLLSDMQVILSEISNRNKKVVITLPSRLSVSTLLYLAKDPKELALRLRRPMPNHIDKYARRGTDFHLWLENYFKHPSLISMDDLFNQSSSALAEEFADAPFDKLKSAWLLSEWATKQPVGVEVGFETMIDNTLIRGRIDAVYQSGDRYEVIDWKTGKVKDGEDLATAAIQLAMYRLAYSKLKNIPIENVSAAFHYVADNQTVRVADVLDEASLIALITNIPIEV
jgi:DNA helicase-2/ATP-dependent DNA helicase PcrA